MAQAEAQTEKLERTHFFLRPDQNAALSMVAFTRSIEQGKRVTNGELVREAIDLLLTQNMYINVQEAK